MSLKLDNVQQKDIQVIKYDPDNVEEWGQSLYATAKILRCEHFFTINYLIKTSDEHASVCPNEKGLGTKHLQSSVQTRSKYSSSSSSSSKKNKDKDPDVTVVTSSVTLDDAKQRLARLKLLDTVNKRKYFYIADDKWEGSEEDTKRTILWKRAIASLKDYPFLYLDITEGDMLGLWTNCLSQTQPNPRESTIGIIKRLVAAHKFSSTGFSHWIAELNKIFKDLHTLDVEISEELRLGFLFYLMQNDSRYKDILQRLRDSDAPFSDCVARLSRKAVEINDNTNKNSQQRPQVSGVQNAQPSRNEWLVQNVCTLASQR